jgi:tRNA threonylcarbamoyladenosine biosynthesis protein TsaB
MIVLALEFSSPIRSVAVLGNGSILGRAHESGTRETKAFALIDAALNEAAVNRGAVTKIAVGLGPGSYAGIRIAIAIARGWHSATGVEMVGFTSADCVAHQVSGHGEFTVVVDAQRGEFYGARYRKSNDSITLVEPFRMLGQKEWPPRDDKELFLRPDVLEHGKHSRAAPPDAVTLARIAIGSLNATAAHDLDPIYLRRAEFVKAPPRFSAD